MVISKKFALRSRKAILLLGVTFAILLLFVLVQRLARRENVSLAPVNKIIINGIHVDQTKGEIRFPAKIVKNKGWVQFLVYVYGYKWLEKESAIVSQVKLVDLQKAIAYLDWKLWDDLYLNKKDRRLKMFIKWHRKEFAAEDIVKVRDEETSIKDFIFLGSPFFDPIALEAPPAATCDTCPVYTLEEKSLRKEFYRASGKSGYELNSFMLPARGTKVEVILLKY